MVNKISIFSILALLSSTALAAPNCSRAPKAHKRQITASQSTVTTTSLVYTTVTVDESTTTTSTTTTTSASSLSSASSTLTTSTTTQTTHATSSATTASSSTGAASGGVALANFVAPTSEFVDGKYPCSQFPSDQQGIVSADWLGFGGWTGIQMSSGTSPSCVEGGLCSYACQPGMSKTQWPSTQPSDGESRGGLLCQNGYLYRTNTATNYLCEWGQSSGYVKSSLSQTAYLCRTDYPGTENMVVPTCAQPGSVVPMSVVNEDTYYTWQGKKTSAQYYVNNAGVPVDQACVWSSEGSNRGNWAPMVFGSGYTGGMTWLSLFPNPLANGAALNYNVRIVAADSSSVINGECSYVNGVYSGGANGCTVAVTQGSAYFELF